MKRILLFVCAVALLMAAAWYRPGDSGHAIGELALGGGRARHPVQLPAGGDRYTLVVTGTVRPPFHGDARVVVEGEPALPYTVHGSEPVIDLGLRRHPGFRDQTLTGLRPRDRFTLWVVMHRPAADAVPACHAAAPLPAGKYHITFYDTATNQPVLRIPVLFGDGEQEAHHHEG